MNKVSNAYLLWFFCLIGVNGIHRLYNGKVLSGLLWLFTLGLFGFGQIIDLILIPFMVKEYNDQFRAKYNLSPAGVPLGHSVTVESVVRPTPPSPEEMRMKLLVAAAKKGGKLSVTQGVMATGATFDEVEKTLKSMLKSGYVGLENDPVTGVILYDFKEI